MSLSIGFKKYFSNTLWLVSGRVIKALINFIVGVFVARYLGPEKFGLLNYAITIAVLFSIFSTMGLGNVFVRELVKDKESTSQLMGSGLVLRLYGAFISLLLTVILLFFTNADSETWILTLICSISFLFMSTEVFRGFYEATVQGRIIFFIEVFQSLLSAILRIYFIAVKGDVFLFAVCWLTEYIFSGIGLVIIYRIKEGSLKKLKYNPQKLKYLFKESFPLLLSAMAITIYQQIDQIMLKNIVLEGSNEQVGYYSAASRIIPFVIIIPQMIGKALLPSLVNSKKFDSKIYTLRMQLFLDLITWIGIFLSLILFIFSNSIISIYGPNFNDASLLLSILAWKGLLVSLSISAGFWVITEGLQKWAVIRNILGCIVNIILNLIWIPKFAAVGSAWATIISLFVSSYIANIFIKPYRPLFILQTKTFISAPKRLYKILSNFKSKLK